ncbi:M23 family metallopeptidase, partial [Streptomyces toyocaensis]|uniref:M23 family metallopeptidase n=1 Tax=Streptomyces toyocaensis TaxID=55952 RepID=UPI0033EFA751
IRGYAGLTTHVERRGNFVGAAERHLVSSPWAAAPGAPVRAVAAGRVSFAGRVAGRGVVSMELAGTGDPPLRTTHEPVRASVAEGDEVAAGEVIGTVEGAGFHCTGPCVHWGLLRAGTYLDPLGLLPPWLLRRGPSRLLPVLGVPVPG